MIETIDADDEVVHILSAPLDEGTAVRGEIDWTRRFDHMQQHTGQHVLSAAFDRLFENPTTSFHLGSETSTIDLAREMSWEQIARAEDEANRVVWENREVAIRFVDERATSDGAAAAEGAVPRRASAADRGDGLRLSRRAAARTWRARARSGRLS